MIEFRKLPGNIAAEGYEGVDGARDNAVYEELIKHSISAHC
jgi:hypothetical protein